MAFIDLGDFIAIGIAVIIALANDRTMRAKLAELEEELTRQRQNFFHHLDRGEH